MAITLAETLISFVYEEYRAMSIAAGEVLLTVMFVAIATLALSAGSSSSLKVCFVGHSETGFFKNSGPFCHRLFGPISFGFFLL